MIKETTEKEHFSAGSVRNSRVGKGRYDLIANNAQPVFHFYTEGTILEGEVGASLEEAYTEIQAFILDKNLFHLRKSFGIVSYWMDEDTGRFSWIKRLAKHYEGGASVYAPRNWEMGQEVCRYLDSASRHLIQYICEEDDEDHGAAVLWNLLGAAQTLNMIKDGYLSETFNDLPMYPIKAYVKEDNA